MVRLSVRKSKDRLARGRNIVTIQEDFFMKRQLRTFILVVSGIIGIEVVTCMYFILGINPVFVPAGVTLGLWIALTAVIWCGVDEYYKKRFKRIHCVKRH